MKKVSLKLILFVLISVLIVSLSISFILIYSNFLHEFEFEKIVREEIKNVNVDGNCLEYTIYYEKIFKNLRIKTTRIILHVDEITLDDGTILLNGHSFLIVYDETGWCSLDQKKINCVKYIN